MTKPPDPTLRDWNSIAQAVAYLGVSRSTISKWIKDGTLPCSRPSPRITRISGSAIEKMLERNGTPLHHGGSK